MGLDISVSFDNQEQLFVIDEYNGIAEKSSLSRTFCDFMCRRNVVEDCRPELDQLGDLTGVDISFLYAMEEYTDEWEIDEMLEFEDDEIEKEERRQTLIKKNKEVENNITTVRAGLTELIEKLARIPHLEEKLQETKYDTLDIKNYFANFNDNTGDGYIGNNLGQDLRNLLRAIEFGINHGSKTVYFNYG